MKYYSVGINGKWTDEAATKEEITRIIKQKSPGSEVTIQESRLHGDFDLFVDGTKISWLFENKEDQINLLKKKNLIVDFKVKRY